MTPTRFDSQDTSSAETLTWPQNDDLLPPDAIMVEAFVPVAPSDAAARHLVVIRESQKWDARLLKGMAIQVLRRCVAAGIPGASEFLAAVEDDFLPWRRTSAGDRWRREHGAVPLREPNGRTYGYRFTLAGTTFILAATSATTESEEDLSNPFTTDLIALLQGGQYDHLHTGPGTRLVRRKKFGEMLGDEFRKERMVVHTTENGAINFTAGRGYAADTASQVWSMVCQYAENEVKGILLRTLLGRINMMFDGCWTEAPRGAPPHCDLVEEGSKKKLLRLSEDESQLELARGYVRIAAEAQQRLDTKEPMTDTQILKALTEEYGATTSDGRPLTELTKHESAVVRRLKWIAPMHACAFRRRQELTLDGLTPDDVLGLKVAEHRNVKGEQVTSVLFRWELPKLDGIDEETWKLALTYATKRCRDTSQRRKQPTSNVLPLARTFHGQTAGGEPLELRSNGANYEIVQIVDGQAQLGPIGTTPVRVLHRELIRALADAAEDDRIDLTDITLPRTAGSQPAPSPAPSPDAAALNSSRDHLLTEIKRREKWLADDLTPDDAKPPVQAELQSLQASLAEVDDALEEMAVAEQADAEATDGQVRQLADLFALTEAATGPLPRKVRFLWESLLADAEVEVELWSPWIKFSTRLRVQSTDISEVTTRRVTFTVPNVASGLRTVKKRNHRDRYTRVHLPELLRLRCQDGWSIEELAARRGIAPRQLKKALACLLAGKVRHYPQPLVASRELAHAMLDAAAPVRSLLYDLLANRPGGLPWLAGAWTDSSPEKPRTLPCVLKGLTEDETKVYQQALSDRYFTPGESWTVTAWSSGGERERRALAAAVANGTAPTVAAACEVMNWSHTSNLTRHLAGFEAARTPLIELHPDDHALPFAQQRVRRRRCPNCRSDQLHALPVPEVEGGVACRKCRLVIADLSLKLPNVCFDWWEGPFGRNEGTATVHADKIRGTHAASEPPAATPARQQRQQRLTGADWRDHRPGEDPCNAEGCAATATHAATRYCREHQDRSVRNRVRIEAARSQRLCRFEDCPNPPRATAGNGRGRPPEFCDDHSDAYTRRKLTAELRRKGISRDEQQ